MFLGSSTQLSPRGCCPVWGGCFGSHNIGDEAILLGIRNIFKKINPEIQISALTSDPKYAKKVQKVIPVKAGFKKNLKEILKNLITSDLVLVSGGTSIYDYDHLMRIFKTMTPKMFGKKFRFFGVSSRIIKSTYGKKTIRSIVNMSSGISVRESLSKKILGDLGVKKKILVTGDSALFVEPVKTKILGKGKKVCLCPRVLSADHKKHYHEKTTKTQRENMYKNIAESMMNLQDKGFKVYVLPFHTESYDNDWEIINELKSKMKKGYGFEVLNKKSKMTPSEVLGLIKQMDFLIGMRLHSLIFSAICKVPMITYCYDTKIRGFMKMIKMSNYCLSIDSDSDIFLKKSMELMKNKEQISNKIEKSVKKMKSNILKEAKEINEGL